MDPEFDRRLHLRLLLWQFRNARILRPRAGKDPVLRAGELPGPRAVLRHEEGHGLLPRQPVVEVAHQLVGVLAKRLEHAGLGVGNRDGIGLGLHLLDLRQCEFPHDAAAEPGRRGQTVERGRIRRLNRFRPLAELHAVKPDLPVHVEHSDAGVVGLHGMLRRHRFRGRRSLEVQREHRLAVIRVHGQRRPATRVGCAGDPRPEQAFVDRGDVLDDRRRVLPDKFLRDSQHDLRLFRAVVSGRRQRVGHRLGGLVF